MYDYFVIMARVYIHTIYSVPIIVRCALIIYPAQNIIRQASHPVIMDISMIQKLYNVQNVPLVVYPVQIVFPVIFVIQIIQCSEEIVTVLQVKVRFLLKIVTVKILI